MNIIKKWQDYLDLNDWTFSTNQIEKEQVMYDEDVSTCDRYFIGVEVNKNAKSAVIHHDRDLYDEAVIHELLHVKYPQWSEEKVNKETDNIMYLKNHLGFKHKSDLR
jgi:hypothetical protein